MNSEKKSLRHYFREAAARPLELPPDRLRSMLEHHDAVSTAQQGSIGPGSNWMSVAKVSALAMVTVGVWAGATFLGGEKKPSVGAGIAKASAAAAPTLPATPAPRIEANGLGKAVAGSIAARPLGSAPARVKSAEPIASASTTISPASIAVPSIADRGMLADATPAVPIDSAVPSGDIDARIASQQTIHTPSEIDYVPVPTVINGIRTIELTTPELDSIGVEIMPDGHAVFSYNLFTRQEDDDPDASVVVDHAMLADGSGRSTPLAGTKPQVRLRPGRSITNSIISRTCRLITGDRGERLFEFVNDSEVAPEFLGELMRETIDDDVREEIVRRLDSARGMDSVASELRLSGLLPIRVGIGMRGPNDDLPFVRSHVIFWCQPDPELIAALPARVRRELRAELARAGEEPVTGDTVAVVRGRWSKRMLRVIDSLSIDIDMHGLVAQPAEPRAVAGGPTFFGVTRAAAGAIVSSILVPNPASNSSRLRYTLSEQRHVTVALHDIYGRRIRELSSRQVRPSGDSWLEIPLEGVQSGIVLVVVSTERGEQVVRRLVVEKLMAGR